MHGQLQCKHTETFDDAVDVDATKLELQLPHMFHTSTFGNWGGSNDALQHNDVSIALEPVARTGPSNNSHSLVATRRGSRATSSDTPVISGTTSVASTRLVPSWQSGCFSKTPFKALARGDVSKVMETKVAAAERWQASVQAGCPLSIQLVQPVFFLKNNKKI